MFLCETWFAFYPFAVLIIGNRLLALSLICHEGLHGTLCVRPRWNDWMGRWLCAFPAIISFSKYRRIHYMHHRALGHAAWDPDLHLYSHFPCSPLQFIKNQIFQFLQLKTCVSFLLYYTELYEFVQIMRTRQFARMKSQAGVMKETDLISFLFFFVVLLVGVGVMGIWKELLLYWVIPLMCVTQPYVLLMGGLQHGPRPIDQPAVRQSRSIHGPKWLMEILLPLDINYHGEHHLDSRVPHYWLKAFAKDLENQGEITIWQESYGQAIRSLFFSEIRARDGLRRRSAFRHSLLAQK